MNPGPGGSGGGGAGGSAPQNGGCGAANTGGGGGGGYLSCSVPDRDGGSGGSGVVILRVPTAVAPSLSVAPGTNSIVCGPSGTKLVKFTVSGTLTS